MGNEIPEYHESDEDENKNDEPVEDDYIHEDINDYGEL